jgi:hypothetical protein
VSAGLDNSPRFTSDVDLSSDIIFEMQNLWAQVLAGEANSPGTYSKRTVNFLSSLDKKDAALIYSSKPTIPVDWLILTSSLPILVKRTWPVPNVFSF